MPAFSKFNTLFSACNSAVRRSVNLRSKYATVSSVDDFIRRLAIPSISNSSTLDLGCGSVVRNPFAASHLFGVDILASGSHDNIKAADLSISSIPYSDNSFNYCTAYDFIEHIPRLAWPNGCARYSFIELMNEIHRVLVPGGYYFYKVPVYPSKELFMDPTHVNYVTEDTFAYYFCKPCLYAKAIGYGFSGEFTLISQALLDFWLLGVLQKTA